MNSNDINLEQAPFQFHKKYLWAQDKYKKSWFDEGPSLKNILNAIKSHKFLSDIPDPYNSSESTKISYAIATSFLTGQLKNLSAIQKQLLETLFEEFVLMNHQDYLIDPDGNSLIHLLRHPQEIKYFVEKYNLNPNIKNRFDNTPAEHFLHKNLFDKANAAAQV